MMRRVRTSFKICIPLLFLATLSFYPCAALGSKSDIESFISRFSQSVFGIEMDEATFKNVVDGLSEGSLTGDDIAWVFLFNPEFLKRNVSNEEFLNILYLTLLNKNPGEVDPDQYKLLLNALNNGRSREESYNTLINSTEFAVYCGGIGIVPYRNTDFVKRGLWEPDKIYFKYEVVQFGDSYYICRHTHISRSSEIPPNTGLLWGYFHLKGDQGYPGPQGPQGPQGEPGPQGPQGKKGDPGPVGPQGPVGPAGTDGAQGSAGPQGLKGDTGAAGSQGTPGGKWFIGTEYPPLEGVSAEAVDGDHYLDNSTYNIYQRLGGSWGEQPVGNIKGDKGDQGPAGPAGPIGPAGVNGAQGPAGPAGPIGPAGVNGAQGPAGPVGPIGPAGVNGAQGPEGSSGSTWYHGTACEDPNDPLVSGNDGDYYMSFCGCSPPSFYYYNSGVWVYLGGGGC